MKYTTYFTVLFIAFTFLTSCKKDDVTESDSLIGTWQLEQLVEGGVKYDLDDCEKKATIQFKADNSLVETFYEFDGNTCNSDVYSATWKTEGTNTLIITYFFEGNIDSVETYSYSIANGILTLDEIISGTDMSYKIVLKKIN